MRIPPNYVLVLPDADVDADSTGMQHFDVSERHLNKAVSGTIIACCTDLYFCDDVDGTPEQHQESLEWDVPLEVKVGDRVLFRYLAAIDEEGQTPFGYLVRYDSLYARVDPGGLYPLNGFLLLKVDRDDRSVAGLEGHPSYYGAAQVMGSVMAEGALVRAYQLDAWHPDVHFDYLNKIVLYKKNRAVRLEVDERAQHGVGGYSLYRIHRRYVCAIIV